MTEEKTNKDSILNNRDYDLFWDGWFLELRE